MRRQSFSRGGAVVLAAGVLSSMVIPPGLAAERVSQTASWGSKPSTAANPKVPEECGTDITVVLDASGSIGGNNNNVRDAARSFLDALKDTGSRGRILDFATGVRETAGMSLITSASLSGTGVHATALDKYYQNGRKGVPISGQAWKYRGSGNPTDPSRYRGPNNANSSSARQYTNWQQALEGARGQGTRLVVFITDGDPTATTSHRDGRSNQGIDPAPHKPDYLYGLTRGQGQDYAYWKGINAANGLKGSGNQPRVLAVGVGSGLTSPSSINRLKGISGPNVYDGQGDFDLNRYDVATVRDFNKLGEALRKVATELCSPSLTITKLAQSPDNAQYQAASGWDYTVNPTVPTGSYVWTQPDKGDPPGPKSLTTNSNGQAQFQWEPTGKVTSTASIMETSQAGYTFDSAECRRLDDGTPSNDPPFVNGTASFDKKDFSIPVGPESIVTCSYRNSFDYKPGISLTKVAADDPVRGNANGWDERYTFEVRNTGNTPLNGVTVSDGKCLAISGPSGDTDKDGWLDQNETWTYTCNRTISHPTTTASITSDNTAGVIAVDPAKTPVSASAKESVVVKTPAINIEKVAKRPDGTVITPADKVPAGSQVTYEYTVTNTGNDTLQDIQISDDKCSPLTRTSGSGTTLSTTDTWVYTCTTRVQPPSTESVVRNTATVSGKWSNPQNRTQNNGRVTDKATAEVRVEKSATINVVKTAMIGYIPGSQAFDYTLTSPDGNVPTADQSFSLDPLTVPSNAARSVVVEPADGGSEYTVTETGGPGPSGWDLTDLSCTVTGSGTVDSISGGEAKVSLAAGDSATCSYFNERRPSLTINKVAPGGGPGDDFDFSAPALTPSNFSLANGEQQAYSDLSPGVYTITEGTLPGGWVLDQISCGDHPASIDLVNRELSVTLAYADDVHCTFTNRQVTGSATLTVVKQASPADGTDFDFTATGASGGVPPADRSFSLTPNGGPASRTIDITPQVGGEVFTITEVLGALAPDWTLTDHSCLVDGDARGTKSGTGVAVSISPGEKAVCTFTNRANASATAIKLAPTNSALSFPFSWNVASPSGFSLANTGYRSAFPITAGSYRIDELTSDPSFPTDWYLAAGQPFCAGTAAPPAYSGSGVDLTIADGEDAFCLFVNFYDYQPAIQLVKTVDRTQLLNTAGTPAVYTYTMTNTGNEPVEPIGTVDGALVDDYCSPVSRTSGVGTTLAVGDSWTYECTSSPTSDVTNTATATMRGQTSMKTVTGTDQQTVGVTDPDLAITKTGDKDLVYSGDSVTYTYEVSSPGGTPFENPALPSRDEWVTDDRCSPVTYVSGDTSGDMILDPDERWLYECTSVITTDTTNTGTVTATPFLPASTSSGAKQVGTPLTRTDPFEVTVITPGLTIDKSADAPNSTRSGGTLIVDAGATVTYTYDVTSGSADTPMRPLGLVDDKCSPVTYQSGDTSQDGLLDPGETWVYTCEKTFAQAQAVETNIGTVIAVEPKLGRQLQVSSEAKVTALSGGVNLSKRASPDSIAPGEPVTFTYQVTNPSSVPLTDVAVTDDKCSPVEYQSGDKNGDGALAPGETWKFSCTTTLSQTTTNTATATGRPNVGPPATSTSTAVVTVVPPSNAGIAVEKSPSQEKVSKGTPVTYTYKVRNTGSLALADVRLTDDKCDKPKYVKGDVDGNGLLTSGKEKEEYNKEVWTYKCTHSISTKTTNTVVATGQPQSGGHKIGDRVSSQDKATVTVSANGGGGGTASTGANVLTSTVLGVFLLLIGLALQGARRRS